MSIVEDVLSKWADVAEYNPDQKQFNLLSSNYAFHRCGERIKQLLTFDNSGVFAALYAKASFESISKDIQCKLIDLLEHSGALTKYQEFWSIATSVEMQELEQNLISKIVTSTTVHKVIGELDREHEMNIFRDSVEYIAEELIGCRVECFSMQQGTRINKDIQLMKVVKKFNTTSECILTLEHALDGMYLCYISEYDSAGGYFSFMIKSGKNILSVCDRVPERFVGQHTHSRNNRWIEDKKWHIFPYKDIVNPEGTDYLGYAKSLVCKVSEKDISTLSVDSIYRCLLSSFLLLTRYRDKLIDDIVDGTTVEKVYIDSLLSHNIIEGQNKALVPLTENSMICSDHTNIELYDFTSENVASNELQSRYDWHQPNASKHNGSYPLDNMFMIEKFGNGFTLEKNKYLERKWPELTDGKDVEVVAEFIGSREKIELECYRNYRQQLCDHIINNMVKAYNDAGGYKGVVKWYKDSIFENKQFIIDYVTQWYKQYQEGKVQNYEIHPFTIACSSDVVVSCSEGHDAFYSFRVDREFILNKPSGRYDYACPITGTTANVWFCIEPCSSANIQLFTGKELPQILEGFVFSGREGFSAGNPLISSCDPISFIGNPFEHRCRERDRFENARQFQFKFAIGFSKRGLNKLLRERTRL